MCTNLKSLILKLSSLSSSSTTLHLLHARLLRSGLPSNLIVRELSHSPLPDLALLFFSISLRSRLVSPDPFNLPILLRSCAISSLFPSGASLHASSIKFALSHNLFVASALVCFYVSFSHLSPARQVFDEMPRRDAVLWTSMLGGYAQNGEPFLALEMFRQMAREQVRLDWVVMVSMFLVFSQLGWPRPGKTVHGWAVRRFPRMELNLGNALIDMYVKCGELDYAHKVFNKMSERDVISWSALILGYGLNGKVSVAFGLFDGMIDEGVNPNSVTFLGVLSACCHNGLVNEAWKFFCMMKESGVVPELKHYACIVDVLGRAGLLVEAEKLVEEMPVEPDGAVLGALLGACRVHGNVEVGERVSQRLIELEPGKSGYYMLLANIYAGAGRFDDAERVRSFMKERNVGKMPGLSLIEGDSCSSYAGRTEV